MCWNAWYWMNSEGWGPCPLENPCIHPLTQFLQAETDSVQKVIRFDHTILLALTTIKETNSWTTSLVVFPLTWGYPAQPRLQTLLASHLQSSWIIDSRNPRFCMQKRGFRHNRLWPEQLSSVGDYQLFANKRASWPSVRVNLFWHLLLWKVRKRVQTRGIGNYQLLARVLISKHDASVSLTGFLQALSSSSLQASVATAQSPKHVYFVLVK